MLWYGMFSSHDITTITVAVETAVSNAYRVGHRGRACFHYSVCQGLQHAGIILLCVGVDGRWFDEENRYLTAVT